MFYPVFCFINGGFNGGFHYFFSFFWVLAVAILPGRNRVFLFVYVLVVLLTLLVDYIYPSLSVPYDSRAVRYLDLGVSVVLLMAAIYVALNVVMKAYDEANVKLEKQNQQLEELSVQLVEQNKTLDVINQSKDKFFSIIAHDLRGAFNSTQGFSHLLMARYETLTEEQKKQYFAQIESNINKTYDFFENLLEWSRSQRGIIAVNRTNENILLLVKEVKGTFSLIARKKEIEIEVTIPEDLYCNVDKRILATVFRNLIGNALKYTGHHGVIKVAAELLSFGELHISVSDNGIGMSEADLEGLFQIAKSSSRQGTDGEPGTGLGLVLCKELIEKHGGHIEVSSELGKGSCFVFTVR